MQQRIHRQQEGSLIYYTSDNITTKHLFTTKFGGVSKGYLASLNLGFNRGDERSNVLQNYQILADHFRVPRARMTMTKQIHSDIVRVVDENTMGMGLGQPMSWKADAIITNLPHVPLCGYYADCVVTLLHDPVSKSIGVCHSGWRGTASGILGKTVQRMQEQYGAKPEDIEAAIGPAIRHDGNHGRIRHAVYSAARQEIFPRFAGNQQRTAGALRGAKYRRQRYVHQVYA